MGYLSVVMIKLFKDHPKIKKVLQLVLGALTTFSTFQFELVTLLYSHHIILALVYAFISYCFGVILCWIGMTLEVLHLDTSSFNYDWRWFRRCR